MTALAFKDIIEPIENTIVHTYETVLGLPQFIVDKIVETFIPDENRVNALIEAFVLEFQMKFNIDLEIWTVIFSEELPVTDVYIPSYYIPGIGNTPLQVLDVTYFVQGIAYFRPFIRGFIILLLAMYWVKAVLSFIKQDAGYDTTHPTKDEKSVRNRG